jgi:hypothetical protein
MRPERLSRHRGSGRPDTRTQGSSSSRREESDEEAAAAHRFYLLDSQPADEWRRIREAGGSTHRAARVLAAAARMRHRPPHS